MSDKNIEAKHLLRCSGYSWSVVPQQSLLLLHRRRYFIRLIINGQSKENSGDIFHLIESRLLSNKCQPPLVFPVWASFMLRCVSSQSSFCSLLPCMFLLGDRHGESAVYTDIHSVFFVPLCEKILSQRHKEYKGNHQFVTARKILIFKRF